MLVVIITLVLAVVVVLVIDLGTRPRKGIDYETEDDDDHDGGDDYEEGYEEGLARNRVLREGSIMSTTTTTRTKKIDYDGIDDQDYAADP